MPINLEPEDEITSSEDLISLAEVKARVGYLKPFHVEDLRIPESAVTDPTVAAFATADEAEGYRVRQPDGEREHLTVCTWTDEAGELAALRSLLAAMEATGSERVAAINAGYLRTVVEDDAEGRAGADAVAILGAYVDWDRMTEDYKAQLTRVAYRGTAFYLEP